MPAQSFAACLFEQQLCPLLLPASTRNSSATTALGATWCTKAHKKIKTRQAPAHFFDAQRRRLGSEPPSLNPRRASFRKPSAPASGSTPKRCRAAPTGPRRGRKRHLVEQRDVKRSRPSERSCRRAANGAAEKLLNCAEKTVGAPAGVVPRRSAAPSPHRWPGTCKSAEAAQPAFALFCRPRPSPQIEIQASSSPRSPCRATARESKKRARTFSP